VPAVRCCLAAPDPVLKIIKMYKKGVDIPILKTKSGFNDKKVRNIVQKAFKEGKIKRVDKGIYVKTWINSIVYPD
jgi:hypothetical protein